MDGRSVHAVSPFFSCDDTIYLDFIVVTMIGLSRAH